MEFAIKQIADVYKANITLNGITVLAGKNNTGKSTVSKSLWCMIRSLDNIGKQVEHERGVRYARILERILHESTYDTPLVRNSYGKVLQMAQDFARKSEGGSLDPDLVKRELRESFPSLGEEPQIGLLFEDELNEGVDRVAELVEFSTIPSGDIARVLLQNRLLNEFHTQVNNVDTHSKGTMVLKRGKLEFTASIINDSVVDFCVGTGLRQTAIYLDDPFVLDYYSSTVARRRHADARNEDHRSHANALLHPAETYGGDVLGSIMADRKIDEVMGRLDSVVSGLTASSRKHGIVYRRPEGKSDLDVRSISSGMKTFAGIKTLLHENRIHDGDILILDEPENHLHPEWQLVFAELIVLLYRAFNLRILLATHSPYFLRAIEVYSAHYGMADRCKYYHAMHDEDGSFFQDVTFDTDEIYEDMSVPFDLLDELMPEE